MAEPMDLSDEALMDRASNWLYDGHFQPGPDDPDVRSLARMFRAIRDAAMAAERDRGERICAYLAEMMESGAGDYPKGARLRQAARMIHDGGHD